MMAFRNLHLYSIILLFISTFTSAWPWPRWLPEIDSLIVRQNTDQKGNSTTVGTTASTGSTSKASQTGSVTNTKSQSGSVTNAPSLTLSYETQSIISSGKTIAVTKTFTESSKNPSNTVHGTTSYDATNPAGGIAMITPAVIAGPQYFKIGDYVTFAWNYTDLLATPTAVDIMATCTANQQLYTIAANQTVGNSTGAVTWDTGAYQATALQNPLLTQTYTLIIYDAASQISATAQPGYLAVYDQYTFGMYTPQPYTPLANWKCATCSGALSDMERRALGGVLGMCVITVLSFSWFVGGLGVIW